MTTTRYPLAPLASALGIDATTLEGSTELAAHFARDPRTIRRWAVLGVPPDQRERLDDIASGIARRHPTSLWPDWWRRWELDCTCDTDDCTCGFYADDEVAVSNIAA